MMRTDGLRPIVEDLDREMSRLLARAVVVPDTTALLSSWAKLVEFLALGPARELRACPFCGTTGMRAATRCGTCWRKLDPLAPLQPQEARHEPRRPITLYVKEPAAEQPRGTSCSPRP